MTETQQRIHAHEGQSVLAPNQREGVNGCLSKLYFKPSYQVNTMTEYVHCVCSSKESPLAPLPHPLPDLVLGFILDRREAKSHRWSFST